MVILLVLVGIAVTVTVAHLVVPTILRSERHALMSGGTMLITVKKQDTSDLIKLRPWTYKRALWSGAVFVEI